MDIVDRLQNKKRNTTDEEDDALTEIQILRTKVAWADVLVDALRENTYSHDGYARKKAEQTLATYDKLSEVKHDTNK